jgi:hypothetical protein
MSKFNRGVDEDFFEFQGDVIPDRLTTDSDSGTIRVGSNTAGSSSLRLDNSAGTDNHYADVSMGNLDYRAQDGKMYFEARFLLERVISGINIGFNDTATESTLPIELDGTTFASNASTWVGVVYDNDATTDNFYFFFVDGDTDTTEAIANLDSGVAAEASVWYTVRIDVDDVNSSSKARATISIQKDSSPATFASKTFTSSITRSTGMTPHIGIENRTTTGAYTDIDYMLVGKGRVADA